MVETCCLFEIHFVGSTSMEETLCSIFLYPLEQNLTLGSRKWSAVKMSVESCCYLQNSLLWFLFYERNVLFYFLALCIPENRVILSGVLGLESSQVACKSALLFVITSLVKFLSSQHFDCDHLKWNLTLWTASVDLLSCSSSFLCYVCCLVAYPLGYALDKFGGIPSLWGFLRIPLLAHTVL